MQRSLACSLLCLCLTFLVPTTNVSAQSSTGTPSPAEPSRSPAELSRYELAILAMGSRLEIIVYTQTEQQAKEVIDAGLAEIERLSKILSNYDAESEISRLCATQVDSPFSMSSDLAKVLALSKRWHQWSDGKFDVTVGPLTELWRQARKQKQLPNKEEVARSRQRCGWELVQCDFNLESLVSSQTSDLSIGDQRGYPVRLLAAEMVVDLSGIATGYIVDRAFEKMSTFGYPSVLINAGGDIRVGDPPPAQNGWRVSIAGLKKNAPPLLNLSLRNCAVTTSGDLFQYVEIEGRRYSHFMDPSTGEPVERRQSVTVIAATTVDADAGATSLALLGMERSASLFDSLPLKEAILLETEGDETSHARLRWLTK